MVFCPTKSRLLAFIARLMMLADRGVEDGHLRAHPAHQAGATVNAGRGISVWTPPPDPEYSSPSADGLEGVSFFPFFWRHCPACFAVRHRPTALKPFSAVFVSLHAQEGDAGSSPRHR